MSQHDAIYLAGFFDGEGCVGIYTKALRHSGTGAVNPYCYLSMSIANTHYGVLEHIKAVCGGIIGFSEEFPLQKNGKPRSRVWRWSAQARESAHILRQILPYVIVKKEQVALALEFAAVTASWDRKARIPGRAGALPLSPEEIAERLDFARRMKELKLVNKLPCSY